MVRKIQTSLKIDPDLLALSKVEGINLSETLANSLHDILGSENKEKTALYERQADNLKTFLSDEIHDDVIHNLVMLNYWRDRTGKTPQELIDLKVKKMHERYLVRKEKKAKYSGSKIIDSIKSKMNFKSDDYEKYKRDQIER